MKIKIFKKIDNDVWIDTYEDLDGNITPNKIKVEGIEILIFSFIDKNNLPRIIFENNTGKIFKIPNLETIGIDNVMYTIEPEDEKVYLDISCKIEGFKRYYIDFTNKLINYLKEEFSLIESYNKAFEEWKAFLHMKGAKLSLEEQYGLIAELSVLCDLIEILKPIEAMKSWRGPYRELDFKFKKIEIEVKATLKIKHEHVINGLDQLLRKKDNLGVISFCLTKVLENNGFSLPDYVLKVEDFLIGYPALLIEFRAILSDELKYDIIDEDTYNSNRFEFKEIKYFDIVDMFPVFTRNNLKAPLPDNISNIDYTMDFTNLKSNNYDSTFIKKTLNGN